MNKAEINDSLLNNSQNIQFDELNKETNYKNGFYLISIKKVAMSDMMVYESKLLIENTIDYINLKNKFIKFLNDNFSEINAELGFIKLEKLLELIRSFFINTSNHRKNHVNNSETEFKITLFWAYMTGLIKILPLLLDQNVEEIFISPNSENITLDHFQFGRMTTNILISPKEKDNILYRIAMENNLELNQLKPSIKGDLQVNKLFSVRVTGDIKPFSYDGTIINIRKLNQREFDLKLLIKLHSINAISSAFMKTIISNGINFTIIGSPSSGKTTLQNALLREMPNHWRIFSFENTLETNIRKNNFFRFKIYDYLKKNYDLLTIFSQLLHRSPDFVNLGEITNKAEALAWNACMSAGIPIIQTIHSNSSQGLINRITRVFEIPIELLANSLPHIVVEVKYFWNNYKKERKIFSISEFVLENNQELRLYPLTTFDFQLKKLIWKDNPTKSKTFLWIKENKNPKIEDLMNANFQIYRSL